MRRSCRSRRWRRLEEGGLIGWKVWVDGLNGKKKASLVLSRLVGLALVGALVMTLCL